MIINQLFPPVPERPANPPEPRANARRDRLFDARDTLRHEAFALQNQLFKAPRHKRACLKRLLAENQAAQAVLCDALSALGDIV